jgi:hypothetical protein
MENLKRVLDAHAKSIIDEEMGTKLDSNDFIEQFLTDKEKIHRKKQFMKGGSKIKINGGEYMKTRIKFFLITGVFSLLVSCTGKEKVQQPIKTDSNSFTGMASENTSAMKINSELG